MEIITYQTEQGKLPFEEWRDGLSSSDRAAVRMRLNRLLIGNFGDWKTLKNAHGVCELRINMGPGYRIYFGKKGGSFVILLTGGGKASQERDIEKAKKYWLDYQERCHGK